MSATDTVWAAYWDGVTPDDAPDDAPDAQECASEDAAHHAAGKKPGGCVAKRAADSTNWWTWRPGDASLRSSYMYTRDMTNVVG